MSGEEIVNALRCCASVDGTGCAECSDEELNNDELLSCADVLKNAAADLIENQRNHIRALMQANDALRRGEVLEDRPNIKVLCAMNADRLLELAKADEEGRLVVLPCKVSDTVWVTGRDNVPREMRLNSPDIRTVCTDEDNLCMATCNRKPDGFCAYRLRNDGTDIGKTVFLTREEAERAWGTKRNG